MSKILGTCGRRASGLWPLASGVTEIYQANYILSVAIAKLERCSMTENNKYLPVNEGKHLYYMSGNPAPCSPNCKRSSIHVHTEGTGILQSISCRLDKESVQSK